MKIVQPSFEILDHSNLTATIEIGGRTCYKSEDKICDGSADPFIEKIKNFKHECYSADTDVLTADGWKSWSAVSMDDFFATLDARGNIEYHKPLSTYEGEHNGLMYRVDAAGVDLLVTPNHRMYVCKTSTKSGRARENYEFVTAEELGAKSHAYTKVGRWRGGHSGLNPSATRLLGFTIGDGWVQGKRVYFNLRKPRKIEWLDAVADELDCEVLVGANGTRSVPIPDGCRALFENTVSNGARQIPHGVILSWRSQELDWLLDGLLEADGHRGKTSTSLSTVSPKLADQVQQLCLHIGIAATIRSRQPKPNSLRAKPKRLYTVTILQRSLLPEVNKCKTAKPQTSWEYYSGKVYCAQVPHGTLYVRRGGTPVWCGNSVLEHGTVTVRILCDRGVTHELVRHRLASFSQESSRYCNYAKGKFGNEITVVAPQSVLTQRQYDCWARAMEIAEEQYLEMVELGASAQQARSVLPNSLKAEIVITANPREWRHIFAVRTHRDAHPDMVATMRPILKEFRARWPVLFNDVGTLGDTA